MQGHIALHLHYSWLVRIELGLVVMALFMGGVADGLVECDLQSLCIVKSGLWVVWLRSASGVF